MKKEIKAVFTDSYITTISELAKLKSMLRDEDKNQTEILKSENLNYSPDFSYNIERIMLQLFTVLNNDENLESQFMQYHDLMNYDLLQERMQYMIHEYLNMFNNRMIFDNRIYYLMDDNQTEIQMVDLEACYMFYDTICDLLINDLMINIDNLDEIDNYDLRIENQVLSLNDGGSYNLLFDNGSYLQSENIHVYKFQSPLFSALICRYLKGIK